MVYSLDVQCALILRKIMMTDITKVVVIDEQPLFREGLIGALTSTFKKRTIEQCSNGSEGIRLSHRLDPHIVSFDAGKRSCGARGITGWR